MATDGAGGGGGPADFIGALISLISKSDIRYQGLLAQIDPVKATIALEQVRSYGTEGRVASAGRPQDEIPPGANTYEFVTFRAADVKDLRIDDPHPPKQQQQQQQDFVDPAILGTSPPVRFGGGGPPGPPGPYGPPMGQWGPPPPTAAYSGFGPGPFVGPPPPHFGAPGGPGGSSQTQPPGNPNMPQGRGMPPPPAQQSTPAQPHSAAVAATAPATSPSHPGQKGPKDQKVAVPASGTNGVSDNVPKGPSKSLQADAVGRKEAKKADAEQVVADLSKLSVSNKQQEASTKTLLPSTAPPQPTKAVVARSPIAKASLPARPANPRGTSGSGAGSSASRAPRGPPASVFDNNPSHNGAGHVEVPSSDFDFESANAKFAKERLEGEKQSTVAGSADDVLDAIPPAKEDAKNFYDKSSFFDNISSEVRERHDRVTSPQQERRGGLTTGFEAEGRERAGDHEGSRRGGRGGGRGGGRQARFEEDRKNLDTFGEVGSSRGGGRGGRGGRGRGRGRGGPRHGPRVEA